MLGFCCFLGVIALPYTQPNAVIGKSVFVSFEIILIGFRFSLSVFKKNFHFLLPNLLSITKRQWEATDSIGLDD